MSATRVFTDHQPTAAPAAEEPPMSPTPTMEGDDLRLPTRLIVAPEAGTFRPAAPLTCTSEGEMVTPGVRVGTIESLGRAVAVTSAFDGFLMGMLALPGERVRAGQPIAWLHSVAAPVTR